MPCITQAQEVRSGEAVLRAMHDRYQASWYPTVTFTQKSTTYKDDGTTKVETWHEAALLPGRLRIDIGDPKDGNGFVLVDGSLAIVKGGNVAKKEPLINMLLVLGFDIYQQDADKTIGIVKNQGYDLAKLREDMWEGHAVYVIGADKDDLQSRQFWVEKDSLLFVREIEPSRSEPKKMEDIRFTNYRRLQVGWIAARVEVHANDKLIFSEDYSDIQAGTPLVPAVFDPAQFNTTHWEK